MSWKDCIRTTPVIVICYIISITLIGLLVYTKWTKFEDDEIPKKTPSIERGQSIKDKPRIPARDAVWQDVDGVTYVYAAYYDGRGRWPKSVRIIGATKAHKGEVFRCRFWYSNRTYTTFKAKLQPFHRHSINFRYTACFIVCPFTTEEIPNSVSVVKHTKRVKNHLTVINTKKYDKTIIHPSIRAKYHLANNRTSETIGLCVKPLYNNYNDSVQLVEFMELNRVLGMDHVTLYKSSISHTIECILWSYIEEGRATLATAMPWKNSDKVNVEIRNANALATLNDCLYRNMHNFSYLAFLDMDEFIVPRHSTLQRLIETLNTTSLDFPYKIGSYSFQNGLFYLEWPNDPATEASLNVYARSLTTLMKTTRRMYLHPHGTRSKYIVKPTAVKEVGKHSVSHFVRGFGRLAGLESEAILNHYRRCEYGGSKCTNETATVDKNVFRYKPQLIEAVKLRWEKLQQRCGMEDIHHLKMKKSSNNGL